MAAPASHLAVANLGELVQQRITSLLELLDAGDARRRLQQRVARVATAQLARMTGQLLLEARDLAPQLAPRRSVVGAALDVGRRGRGKGGAV